MALFKKKARLPEPPPPSGPDEWLGDGEIGHTVRELVYLESLKAAGVPLEAPRTIAFGFVATNEGAATAAITALEEMPFDVNVTQPSGGAVWVISATSQSLGLVPGLATWAQQMRAIGAAEGIVYDGWLAMFDDVSPGSYVNYTIAHQ